MNSVKDQTVFEVHIRGGGVPYQIFLNDFPVFEYQRVYAIQVDLGRSDLVKRGLNVLRLDVIDPRQAISGTLEVTIVKRQHGQQLVTAQLTAKLQAATKQITFASTEATERNRFVANSNGRTALVEWMNPMPNWPRWAWEDASPVATIQNAIAKTRAVYSSLATLIANRDIASLRQLFRIKVREAAIATAQTEEDIWRSLLIEAKLQNPEILTPLVDVTALEPRVVAEGRGLMLMEGTRFGPVWIRDPELSMQYRLSPIVSFIGSHAMIVR